MKNKKSISDSHDLVTRRSLFKGMSAGLVAGGLASAPVANLTAQSKGKKRGVRKGQINQSVVSGVLQIIGVWRKLASMRRIWAVRV